MYSTILEMANTQLTVLSPLSGIWGCWWLLEGAKWNLLYNHYQNQPILGNIFQTGLMLIFPKQIFEQRACWPRGWYPVSPRGNGNPRPGAWSASMRAQLGDFFQGGIEMAKHVWFWLVAPFWKWQIPSRRELFEVIRYFYCKMISLILNMEILHPIRPLL